MLRVFPLTKKYLQPYLLQEWFERAWLIAQHRSLFNSFRRDVAKQVARFLFAVVVGRFTVA